MQELQYPFDSAYILSKSKKIKRQLLEEAKNKKLLKKNIAVLGGSTTHDIVRVLELFLLNEGIEPAFYESEYAQYWQDAMFPGKELQEFNPDLIFVHTSNRNITEYPNLKDTPEEVEAKLTKQYEHFRVMWERLEQNFHCPVIQNNFELPSYRLLGNREAYDIHGTVSFINKLNMKFGEYASSRESFYINDLNYIAASYGLDAWCDSFYWHMYKYAMSMQAIPTFAFNLSHIIKAIWGKNKKALVLDLDNTLWGGIVGDDGAENLEIGQETSLGQAYQEFQKYLKAHQEIGVLLNVDSKNEYENAIAGLEHPEGVLRPDDFICIKANWEPKSRNLTDIASELNLGVDSMVFVDDNPTEREIIRQQVPDAAVPRMTESEPSADKYIRILDHNGYFETIALSVDDQRRNEMYKANAKRASAEASFSDYTEFLRSLEMKAVIKGFEPMYYSRIAQLTNKSNQFNLTTLRCTQAQIESMAENAEEYITLYGKLEDKFGDNGVVSLLIGQKDKNNPKNLNMILWLMSCRVLKRDMECAMMDSLVAECNKQGYETITGFYYPTAKNNMVREFYDTMKFESVSEDEEGNRTYIFRLTDDYEVMNKVIEVD